MGNLELCDKSIQKPSICLNENRKPSFFDDPKKIIEHLSQRLGLIFLAANKNRIDQVIKEIKKTKEVNIYHD